MYYLILLLGISLLTFVLYKLGVDVKKNQWYLLSMFIVLTLFLGLRGNNVGLDMQNYHDFFDFCLISDYGTITQYVNFEIGFKLLSKTISLFTNNFSVYIFLLSTISMIGVFFFIKENSKNYFSSIYIFIAFSFYITFFCTIRQGIAISILLLAYNFLKGSKYVHFVFLVLLATLFHKTAIVFLLLIFFKKFPLKKKWVSIYLISCLVLFIIKGPLIQLATKLLYDNYIGYKDMSGGGYSMLILIFGIIISICYLFRLETFKVNNKNNRILIGMILLSFPIQILATTQGLLARIVLYFTFSLIILLPNFLEEFFPKYRLTLNIAYYTLLLMFYILEIVTNNMYMPYCLIW